MNIYKILFSSFFFLLGLVTFVVAYIFLNAFVLSKLWEWYITPYFGFPILPISVSVGIFTIMSFLTHHISNAKEEDNEKIKITNRMAVLIRPVFFLLIGWLVQFFIPIDLEPIFNKQPVVMESINK